MLSPARAENLVRGNEESVELSITDVLGRSACKNLILTPSGKFINFNLSNIEQGIYVISAQGQLSRKVTSKKLFVIR